jgi:hypothetical protein
MSEVRINNFVDDHLDDMVILTGLPRSGTTILGRLVGSFRSVEYAFEPPVVAYLDAQSRHDILESSTISELLKVYLYYDYFAEFVHGRKYNFRPSDASNVLAMQTVPEILDKWNRVATMDDAVKTATEYTFSFKFPGVYHVLSDFYNRFPTVHVVDIGRNLDRVLISLFNKQWFFDQNLGEDATGLWPFHETNGQYVVPYLVAEDDIEWWQTMSAETRTVYICNRLAEDRLAFEEQYGDRDTYHQIRYERLIDEPETITDELTTILGLSRGSTTNAIIDEIEPTTADGTVNSILQAADEKAQERFSDLRPQFSY